MTYEQIDATQIGNKMRTMRADSGMSAEEVAKSIGVSTSAIVMYENGFRIPRDEIKIRIAEFYGVPVESIFFPLA